MTLRELEPGDVFVHAKSKAKKPKRFIVYGNPEFNPGYGSATRKCRTLDGVIVGKSCKLEVIPVGISKHKDKIMEMFSQKLNA